MIFFRDCSRFSTAVVGIAKRAEGRIDVGFEVYGERSGGVGRRDDGGGEGVAGVSDGDKEERAAADSKKEGYIYGWF